ncbi:hypothetical protein [Mesorhizobium sp.]|uniref:hypothetical protein n=1 Tax=Mesorhizobium sp. TaxID=1871066 RepID=UPI000FEA0063|nr:hypothetical protein [Mesorhizobium sp.]RWP25041.1 MAG: hypothetical protein EOR02_30220 [Mesorhizobium sp.]
MSESLSATTTGTSTEQPLMAEIDPGFAQLLADYPGQFDVIGDVKSHWLNHSLHWAVASGVQNTTFGPRNGTVLEFLQKHMQSFESRLKKDGKCFVSGEIGSSNKRGNKTMRSNCMIVIDDDTGTSRDRSIELIRERGYAAVVYPTFNDQKPVTFIKNDDFVRWAQANDRDTIATIETAGLYLAKVKGYQPHVVASIHTVEMDDDDGPAFRVAHDPFDKTRIILFPTTWN